MGAKLRGNREIIKKTRHGKPRSLERSVGSEYISGLLLDTKLWLVS